MSGKSHKERSWKGAAMALGITPEEYARHRNSGQYWCTGCKAWRAYEQFYVRKSGPDAGQLVTGRGCRICKKKAAEEFKAAYFAEHGVPYVRKRRRGAA